jgi:hypothetical protein
MRIPHMYGVYRLIYSEVSGEAQYPVLSTNLLAPCGAIASRPFAVAYLSFPRRLASLFNIMFLNLQLVLSVKSRRKADAHFVGSKTAFWSSCIPYIPPCFFSFALENALFGRKTTNINSSS